VAVSVSERIIFERKGGLVTTSGSEYWRGSFYAFAVAPALKAIRRRSG